MLPPSDCRDAYIPAAAVAMEYMMKGEGGGGGRRGKGKEGGEGGGRRGRRGKEEEEGEGEGDENNKHLAAFHHKL